jgi:hypothetical protein
VRCGKDAVQVHHVTPLHTLTHSETFGDWYRAGKRVRHSHSGCWHHLDGLETLCDDCHHAEHHQSPADQLALVPADTQEGGAADGSET